MIFFFFYHRINEGNGGNVDFSTNGDGIHLVKWNAVSILHKVSAVDVQLEMKKMEITKSFVPRGQICQLYDQGTRPGRSSW